MEIPELIIEKPTITLITPEAIQVPVPNTEVLQVQELNMEPQDLLVLNMAHLEVQQVPNMEQLDMKVAPELIMILIQEQVKITLEENIQLPGVFLRLLVALEEIMVPPEVEANVMEPKGHTKMLHIKFRGRSRDTDLLMDNDRLKIWGD